MAIITAGGGAGEVTAAGSNAAGKVGVGAWPVSYSEKFLGCRESRHSALLC
jgi:hypothetical protein